jgi:FAD/FMN-containing dehydrogenase
LRASADQNADLFWALRGAGANFGVVTSLEYCLHEVGPVLGGLILHHASAAAEVLRFHDEFSRGTPDEVSTIGALLSAPDGTPLVGTAVCYSGGNLAEGEKLLEPLRKFGSPVADLISVRPYCDMQTLFDAAWAPGRHYYNKSHVARLLTEGAIETLIEHARSMPTPLTVIALQQLHGAAARVDISETAFPHRYDHYAIYIHPASENAADKDRMILWARACWEAMKEHVEPAVYVNALEDAQEEGEARVRAAYGPNYDRLARLKARYDPLNFFRQNANIKPTSASARATNE